MKLYVLNCGQVCDEKAFLWHFGSKEDTGKEYLSEVFQHMKSIYFIDHPEAKLLFDTGWKFEDFNKHMGFPNRRCHEGWTCKQEPDENPVAQLEKVKVSIDDIDYVVIILWKNMPAGYRSLPGKRPRLWYSRKNMITHID